MIFWTAATWILTPLGVFYFGFNAVAFISAIISTSFVFVVFLVRKYLDFNVFRVVTFPALASFVMGAVIYFLSPLIITNPLGLIFMIVVGGMVYFSMMFLMAKNQILSDLRLIKSNFLDK